MLVRFVLGRTFGYVWFCRQLVSVPGKSLFHFGKINLGRFDPVCYFIPRRAGIFGVQDQQTHQPLGGCFFYCSFYCGRRNLSDVWSLRQPLQLVSYVLTNDKVRLKIKNHNAKWRYCKAMLLSIWVYRCVSFWGSAADLPLIWRRRYKVVDNRRVFDIMRV